MATKNDEVILGLKKEIEAKKALLAKNQKFTPVTNCNLEFEGRRYNIHVETKESLLLLIGRLASIKTGAAVEMPDETITIGGFSIDQWIKDMKSKYAILNVTLEEQRLKALEKKLHDLLSTDKKIELEIDDLKSQI